MFDTLYRVKINWFVLPAIAILILVVTPGISMWGFFALMITAHQFVLLFYSVGYILPIRYLAGSLMCLQILLGSTLAYSGLDNIQIMRYRMQVPQEQYFSYAIPACLMFIAGLHFFCRLRGEQINLAEVKKYVQQHPRIMYIMIGVGFVSSILSGFTGSELSFILYLIGSAKFVGTFLLILGSERLRPLPIIVVFGSIILSSLGSAMFHDLIIWIFFLLIVFALKYKPSIPIKAVTVIGLIFLIVVIQQIKGIYRQTTQLQGKSGDIEAFDDALDEAEASGGLFDMDRLARNNVRINQGFIITYIMNHVPAKEPYAEGRELVKILEAAFLPRVLAPNKLKAGDNSLVYQYSGILLRKHTSMSLSAPGDGYINFGSIGGSIFMFILGGLFNVVLIWFNRFAKTIPIAVLFMPLIFCYPIRPDTALQTSLGHLVKAAFLIYLFFHYWRRHLVNRQVQRVVTIPKTA